MARKLKKNEELSQGEKFISFARDLECDEDEKAFDASLVKIAGGKNRHKSDCATNNAPAMEPGRCTCGATKDGR